MAAAKKCETGPRGAALIEGARRVAVAMTPHVPPGHAVAFVLINLETGALVASALPAAEPVEIAELLEHAITNIRGGTLVRTATDAYDRTTGETIASSEEDAVPPCTMCGAGAGEDCTDRPGLNPLGTRRFHETRLVTLAEARRRERAH